MDMFIEIISNKSGFVIWLVNVVLVDVSVCQGHNLCILL